eukprot:scaffold31941_cov69-Attheya_sp.AAC.2
MGWSDISAVFSLAVINDTYFHSSSSCTSCCLNNHGSKAGIPQTLFHNHGSCCVQHFPSPLSPTYPHPTAIPTIRIDMVVVGNAISTAML